MAKKSTLNSRRRRTQRRIRDLAIFLRDDFRCIYCGTRAEGQELSVEHVVPKARGGGESPGNLVTACRRCNSQRGDAPLTQWARPDMRRRVVLAVEKPIDEDRARVIYEWVVSRTSGG